MKKVFKLLLAIILTFTAVTATSQVLVYPSYPPDEVGSLPESLLAGQMVIYEHELWRGLTASESALPAGTPWPVKGYKEITVKVQWEAVELGITYYVNNLDIEFTVDLQTATDLVLDLATANTNIAVLSTNSYEAYDTPIMQAGFSYHFSGATQGFYFYQESGYMSVGGNTGVFITIKIYPPPIE